MTVDGDCGRVGDLPRALGLALLSLLDADELRALGATLQGRSGTARVSNTGTTEQQVADVADALVVVADELHRPNGRDIITLALIQSQVGEPAFGTALDIARYILLDAWPKP